MAKPDFISPTIQAHRADYDFVDALAGGIEALRAGRELYLPKVEHETDATYATRLKFAAFENFYARAIDDGVGQALSQPLTVEGAPAALTPLLSDINGSGATIDQFANEALWSAIHHGTTFIVADAPRLDGVRTLADQRAARARPFLSLIQAPQVLQAYADTSTGQERLKFFKWTASEVRPSDDLMSEMTVQVVQAYQQLNDGDPVVLRSWELNGGGWVEQEPLVLKNLTEIPVVPCYAWRTGFCTGRPVLIDLARLNIEHYRVFSMQGFVINSTGIPFYTVMGDNLEQFVPNPADPNGPAIPQKLVLNPTVAMVLPKDAKVEMVNSGGAGAVADQQLRLKNLEEAMARASLTSDVQATGTATAALINTANGTAQLKQITLSFVQSLSKALYHLTQLAGIAGGEAIRVSADASFEMPAATKL